MKVTAGKVISAGVGIRKGKKDTPVHLSRSGPYLQEIQFARRIHVVMYDTEYRRGWLVDGASALLHLTRCRLSHPNSYQDFRISDFCHARSGDGADAALFALQNDKNRKLKLFEERETWEEITVTDGRPVHEYKTRVKPWCFEDLVRQTWNILEQIHDHQIRLSSDLGVGLRATNRERLEGFGFMDIVDEEVPLKPRVAYLKPSGRGWVDLIRIINAITLFGSGYGELIQSTRKGSSQFCQYWKTVPEGADYLTAMISTLSGICRKYGNLQANPLELAQGIYWHKADKLFEPCDCEKIFRRSYCDRLQVLLPVSMGRKRNPNAFETKRGAVIFGHKEKYSWAWPNAGSSSKGYSKAYDSGRVSKNSSRERAVNIPGRAISRTRSTGFSSAGGREMSQEKAVGSRQAAYSATGSSFSQQRPVKSYQSNNSAIGIPSRAISQQRSENSIRGIPNRTISRTRSVNSRPSDRHRTRYHRVGPNNKISHIVYTHQGRRKVKFRKYRLRGWVRKLLSKVLKLDADNEF